MSKLDKYKEGLRLKVIKRGSKEMLHSFPKSGKSETFSKSKIKLALESDRQFKIITIIPALILMSVIVVYPLFTLIYRAFTDTNAFNLITGDISLVGLKNFILIFKDKIFLKSILNTLYFVVLSIFLQFCLGVFLAGLVYPLGRKAKNIIITLVLIPTMIADVAVGLVWQSLLNATTGAINYFIELLGFSGIYFLADRRLAMLTIILIAVWQWTPYLFLFILAGMESLKSTYFEVAKLEGASVFQTWIHVILPLIRPVVLVAVFFRATSAIRVFDKVYVLTGGGPGSATETISTYIRRMGFVNLNFGLASAGGVVMLFIAFLIGIISLRYMYKVNEN